MIANTQNIRDLRQWLCWRSEERDGKPTNKVPYSPLTGEKASSTNPETWANYSEAVSAHREHGHHGIGFVFTPEDDLCGVDLDGCLTETGEIESWAREIIEELNSYTEVSPSGRGIHVLLMGSLPIGRQRKGRIEMYDRSRFFTITGHHLANAPATINDRQDELARLHHRVFGTKKAPRAGMLGGKVGTGMSLSDSELLDRAMRAVNGKKFSQLWAGDTSRYATAENDGHSEADLALCSLLAFSCGPDEDRIDRLFRQSGLYRQKWERADYRALTLAAALDRDEFWGGNSAMIKVYARREAVVHRG
jgi:primase-polymerase (primpol)-like protein